MKHTHLILIISLMLAVTGCSSTSGQYDSGLNTKYIQYDKESASSGIGIESNDVVNMTDKMVRSILHETVLSELAAPPRVLVDETDFVIEGNTRINRKSITNRLRNGLTRAAKGKMVFVGRHALRSIEAERRLKREGIVDQGTIRSTAATAGVDFKLVGSINTIDERHANGLTARSHAVYFELVDMELGTIVWADQFEFKKLGADDVVYR